MERIKSVTWEYEDGRHAQVNGAGHVRITSTQVTEESWEEGRKKPKETVKPVRYVTISMPMPAERES